MDSKSSNAFSEGANAVKSPVSPHLFHAIRSELLARTKPSRVPHVLGVEGMSVVLSSIWGADTERCLLAALLHDLAKPYSEDIQREKLDEVTVLPVSEEDRRFPKIWHGLVAAQEAHDVYGVDDPEVLEAVAYHSTGRANIGDIGLVIYLSDFSEPSRNWKGAPEVRADLMQLDLRSAAQRVAQLKLQRFRASDKPIHALALEMDEWLNSNEGQAN